jgi:hypothetical protein
VPQLKLWVGKGRAIEPNLPIIGQDGGLRLVSEAIVSRKNIKRRSELVV